MKQKAYLMLFLLLVLIGLSRVEGLAQEQTAKDRCAQVTVFGAVAKPGQHELTGPIRLSELIELAGGVTGSVGKTVRISRQSKCAETGGESVPPTTVLLRDVSSGGEDASPLIRPGDLVYVSVPEVVYVIGKVKTPSPHLFNPGLTLSQAVRLAGGPREKAELLRVRLIRNSNMTTFKLNEIEKLQMPDPVLQPFDIVDVSDGEGSFGHPGPVPTRMPVDPVRMTPANVGG